MACARRAALFVILCALGCQSPVESADVAGQYKLLSINASPIPQSVAGGPCFGSALICVRAGELWLLEGGDFTWWFYSDSNSSLLDPDGYYTREGRWAVDGHDITLTTPGKSDISGTWAGECSVSISPSATWAFGCV